MDGLHALVMQGKVLYLVRSYSFLPESAQYISMMQGISDTPAWIVSRANQYARMAHKTPFCIYQGRWNVMARDFERDIIPMARMEGMALAPFDVLASGKVRTDEEERVRRETGEKGDDCTVISEWRRTSHNFWLKAARFFLPLGCVQKRSVMCAKSSRK